MSKFNLSKYQFFIISIGATATLFTAVGYWLGQHSLEVSWEGVIPSVMVSDRRPQRYASLDMSEFWQVMDIVTTQYLEREKIVPQKLIQGATAGLVEALDDPYSMYLNQEQNKDSKASLNGTFEGVGMELGYNSEKQLVVIAPLKDSPAKKAGVIAGDKIWQINDEPSISLSTQEAVSKIRGPKGTKVKLLLQQGTAEPREVEIVRETIKINSVEIAYFENDTIAHLQLNRFGDDTESEWDKAVQEITQKNVRKIVLDVRNNPGGYFSTAVHIASDFMNGPVVSQQYYTGEVRTEYAKRSQRLQNAEVAVLINKGSASASEIVTGALNERTEAVVLGETSFGKGTVQDVKDFQNGAGVHITIAKWLTPNNTWVHKEGIKPDIEVIDSNNSDDIDEVLNRAIDELK
ncbi:MAG: peptidase S41 [Patescibacteria group bacterium]|nr:MAG: peptidase S41 [Patescibacteria group bacterium]